MSDAREQLRMACEAARREREIAQERAAAERAGAAQRAESARDAERELAELMARFANQVKEVAPETAQGGGLLQLRLSNAELTVSRAESAAMTEPFQVVAVSAIRLRIPVTRHGYDGRSHSLWYCDADREGEFHWCETAFMDHPLMRARQRTTNPFALAPREAAEAFRPGITALQLAWPFLPIDVNEQEFTERWMGWFSAGANGSLQHPPSMPERTTGSWRGR